MALGKVVHFGVDLVLLSAALAGIRRSTGYKLNSQNLTDSKSIQEYIDKYLFVGEKTIDLAASQMSSYPNFFSRD
ncbi:hypothetical protein H4S02_004466 [Coemansia sp. RSA 2611]|nr:hypothetical protein IWW54_003244 [Coemansia sp. RSA 2705]KAJ2310987.1 hypothetical protein IWW52_005257 [Coemansia sp. RSA 2704]KAJ2327547.1 hypothetical protein IWW51_001687 [Coemansia sp. RSA 2702]KAJ2364271.1 hypothetical protein H4S01_003864 [Coemansia sp. RSA 2610]KAJ2385177.1 hypothetical protein H4S02_004466 [Coemansia sp. RSA 2611]